MERNFGYEIQEYILLKKEYNKRKDKVLSGEITFDEFKTSNQDGGLRDDRD